MPKRKSPEGAEGKEASKVTKQEKPAPPKPDIKPDVKPKKVLSKPVDDKGAKGKKVVSKGRRDDGSAHNGETKTGQICVSRSGVSVSYSRSSAPSLMSVRGRNQTVRVKGTRQ